MVWKPATLAALRTQVLGGPKNPPTSCSENRTCPSLGITVSNVFPGLLMESWSVRHDVPRRKDMKILSSSAVTVRSSVMAIRTEPNERHIIGARELKLVDSLRSSLCAEGLRLLA